MTESIDHHVRGFAAEFTKEPITEIVRITDGSINETFEVLTQEGGRFILQKMSKIFPPAVMNNLAAVQLFLKKEGVAVPEGIQSNGGGEYVLNDAGDWYRALTYLPGKTIHKNITVYGAESSGLLVGRFHNALVGCDAHLTEAISHFHDTSFYMDRMLRIADTNESTKKSETLQPLVNEIIRRHKNIALDISTLPKRIIHADLKVSNIRFSQEGEAIALIDMDTLMYGSIVTEMGDALRSWAGTAGEDNKEQVFDEKIALAGIAGYRKTAKHITEAEISAIPDGISILTLELASRFVADAYEEIYFAKSSQYDSLYAQNKTRAENQLHFLDACDAKRHLIDG